MAGTESGINTCGICEKSFKRKWTLKRHLGNIHNSSLDQSCNGRPTPKLLGKHSVKRPSFSVGENTPGSPCNALSEHGTKRHKVTVSSDIVPSFHTGETIDNVENKGKADVNNNAVAGSSCGIKRGRTCCKVCNRKRYTSDDLRVHNALHKNTGYTCPVCNKVLSVERDKKRHMKLHTGDDLLHCLVCSKLFIQKTDLERHMRQHTGVKPFKCSTCDRSFTRRSVLTRHELTHTGERPYTCKVCQKGFTRPYFLKTHLQEHAEK